MDDSAVFGEAELAFLAELGARNVQYMIVGLSAAALQGAPVVTQDIDLWFRDLKDPHLSEALLKVGAVYVPPTGLAPPVFAGGGLGLFDIVLRMDGLGSFDEEQSLAVKVPLGRCEAPVLRLDRIIASKRSAARQKDKLVLEVLVDTWHTIKAE